MMVHLQQEAIDDNPWADQPTNEEITRLHLLAPDGQVSSGDSSLSEMRLSDSVSICIWY